LAGDTPKLCIAVAGLRENSMAKTACMLGTAALSLMCVVGDGNDSAVRAAGAIPDFAADSSTAWVLDRTRDDLLAPSSGPGPISFDPAHPYIPNGQGPHPTYRVADLTNPILHPWAAAQMKKTNDEVLAGKVPFRAREACWPIGVPGFVIYSLVEPFYFYQTPKEVTVINQGGPEIRHVYLNVPHSKNPKPSWYGESVGHYENGDTLVIDTIGVTDRTFVDNYRTPHTTQLHVVERWKIVEGANAVTVAITVEDPGAFTTAWSATQRWRRIHQAPITEIACNENNANYLEQYRFPNPAAEKPDF
jgi:hypothetical protein